MQGSCTNAQIFITIIVMMVNYTFILKVHSSLSYQQTTYQKYDRHGHESPSGYGP